MKTIIKKLLAHYWLVYPVLILKMFIYYWQTKRLDMLSIYDVPLLSLLFLLCVFEAFSFKESKPRRYGFYIVYTLITLIMLQRIAAILENMYLSTSFIRLQALDRLQEMEM